MKNKFIECGKIVSTHGIRGQLRIQPWCDGPSFLAGFKKLYVGDEKTEIKVISAVPHKTLVIVKFDGIDSIETAEKLIGRTVYIDREDYCLPEGRYFIDDIIGCTVYDADSGKTLGKLTDVIPSNGANDVWEITDNGKEFLVPAISDVLVSVDTDSEKIVIRPMKGIFDED